MHSTAGWEKVRKLYITDIHSQVHLVGFCWLSVWGGLLWENVSNCFKIKSHNSAERGMYLYPILFFIYVTNYVIIYFGKNWKNCLHKRKWIKTVGPTLGLFYTFIRTILIHTGESLKYAPQWPSLIVPYCIFVSFIFLNFQEVGHLSIQITVLSFYLYLDVWRITLLEQHTF